MKPLTILGTGGYTLPLVSNEKLLNYLRPPKDSAWLEKKTGIREHSLNFDPKTGGKKTKELPLDYAERAARKAMNKAGVEPEDIDQLCLATCTPNQIHFMHDVIQLQRRLGLKRTTVVDLVPGGCAALAKGFQLVQAYQALAKSSDWTALMVGVNDVVAFFDLERYRRVPDAWLSPAVFADGAGALVLGPGDGFSLVDTCCAIDGDHELVTYRGGGAEFPTSLSTLDEHAYVMDARDVAAQFGPAMRRSLDYFLRRHEGWLILETIQRWYIHQANFRFIQKFMVDFKIPKEKMPHNVDVLGNTVSASTLLMLDDDMKKGRFPKKGQVIFLFVGAGMMEGGALFSP